MSNNSKRAEGAAQEIGGKIKVNDVSMAMKLQKVIG